MSKTEFDTPFVRIATVLKTKGIEGELLVRTVPGASLLIDDRRVYYLAPPLLEHKTLHLCQADATAQGLKLRFTEISDRQKAHEALGRAVLLKSDDLSDAERVLLADEHGEQFPECGYEVFSDEGILLGTITDRLETGANLVWVVTGPESDKGAEEILLPVIADLQIQRDDERGRVTVHVLEGLLEVNR